MNPRSRLLVPLATVLSLFLAASLTAGPGEAAAMSHRVTAVERNNGTIIERGTTTLIVRQLLGAPHRKLADGVWVYDRFVPCRDTGGDGDGCHMLVLNFVNNRVADMRLVNAGAERSILASLAPVPANGSVVAAK
jgi:hypothetical protein